MKESHAKTPRKRFLGLKNEKRRKNKFEMSLIKAEGFAGGGRTKFLKEGFEGSKPKAFLPHTKKKTFLNNLKRFRVAFFFLCGRSLCVHVFAA